MKDFIFGVQVYDKVTHVTYYQCFFSTCDVAKKHCVISNNMCRKTRFFKVKKIRLFNDLIDF